MKGKFKLALMALMMMACSKEGPISNRDLDFDYGRGLSHEKIVLVLPETKPQLIAPTFSFLSIGMMLWNVLF
jgi:hypothetical protein